MTKLVVSLVVGTTILTGCVEKETLLGTEIKPVKSGFAVEKFDISTKSPDFTKAGVDFDIKFNQEVSAILTITSLTSGAVKKITGTGAELKALWKGGHNGLQFFNAGDKCLVELSFYGSDMVQTDTIVINKAFDFKTNDVLNIFPNNFDGSVSGTSWWFGAVKKAKDPAIQPIQGTDYLYLEGTSPSTSIYVGGGSYGTWTASPIKMVSGDTVSAKANEVWFNIYAYGTGDTETELYFTIFEDDGKKGKAQKTNDGIQVKQTFEHKGWKLFSYKYSDIPFKTYFEAGQKPIGNNTHEPNRIVLWDIGLQVKTAGNKGSAIVDFPIMTVGGPFDPSKY